MNVEQALQAGYAHAQARMPVVEIHDGQEVAAAYAKGMAWFMRDYLRSRIGEHATSYWFVCLGHDSITQPEGA